MNLMRWLFAPLASWTAPTTGAPRFPVDKGIFATFLGVAPEGRKPEDAASLRDRCVEAGVSWVAVLVLWQERPTSPKRTRLVTDSLRPTAELLAAKGIRLIPWAYVIPGEHVQAVSVLDRAERECNVGGDERIVILDAESQWYGADEAHVAAYGIGLDGAGLRGVLTSYGAPWFHSTFPWRAWAKACWWGMPQAYDGGTTSLGPAYPAKSVRAWSALGWGDRITPLSRAYSSPQGPHGAREIEALARRTPTPAGSIGWWDSNALRAMPSRWDGIKAVTLTREVS